MNPMIYRKKWHLILFFTPAILFMTVFLFYPFVVNIYNSFFDIKSLGGSLGEFNNFENYKMIFSDPLMKQSIKNTLILMVCAIVFQVGIALLLAIFVDLIPKYNDFFRTVYFFPIVISATAIGLMFYLFYVQGGALDQIANLFGVTDTPYWLDKDRAVYMLLIPVIWQYVGFYFIIILTGLNNISEEIYEAAEIDGASRLQKIRFITLPLVKPVLSTSIILSVTGSLKVFDIPWTIVPNGMNGTFFTGTYMYYTTFSKRNIDYASTIAIFIVVLGVVVAGVNNFIFERGGDDH